MKYFLVLLFSYLSILFVFSSCDKKCDDDNVWGDDGLCPDAEQSFEDMKAWYFFKEGTYWIYEEQNTGQLDTVIVYSNQENQFDTIYQFEWHATSSLGGFFDQWVNTSWSGHCAEKISCNCHLVFKSRGIPGVGVYEDRPFMFPHIKNNWVSNLWAGGLSTVVSIQETLEFGDFIFYEVVEYNTEIDATQNDNEVFYKFAKNIGMIEKKIPSLNEEWRLVEYGINQ